MGKVKKVSPDSKRWKHQCEMALVTIHPIFNKWWTAESRKDDLGRVLSRISEGSITLACMLNKEDATAIVINLTQDVQHKSSRFIITQPQKEELKISHDSLERGGISHRNPNWVNSPSINIIMDVNKFYGMCDTKHTAIFASCLHNHTLKSHLLSGIITGDLYDMDVPMKPGLLNYLGWTNSPNYTKEWSDVINLKVPIDDLLYRVLDCMDDPGELIHCEDLYKQLNPRRYMQVLLYIFFGLRPKLNKVRDVFNKLYMGGLINRMDL